MCDFSGKLIAWMDRELPAEQATDVERHLKGCAECRARLAEYRQASGGFEAYCDAAVAAGRGVSQGASRSVAGLSAKRTRGLRRGVVLAAGAAGAIAAAAALLLFLPRVRMGRQLADATLRNAAVLRGVGADSREARTRGMDSRTARVASQSTGQTMAGTTASVTTEAATQAETQITTQVKTRAKTHGIGRGEGQVTAGAHARSGFPVQVASRVAVHVASHVKQDSAAELAASRAAAAAPAGAHGMAMQPAEPMPGEPTIEIAIPSEAMFPPGAVPEGMSFVADVTFGMDGSAERVRLQPRLQEFERRANRP